MLFGGVRFAAFTCAAARIRSVCWLYARDLGKSNPTCGVGYVWLLRFAGTCVRPSALFSLPPIDESIAKSCDLVLAALLNAVWCDIRDPVIVVSRPLSRRPHVE